jgi:hypothetical protein
MSPIILLNCASLMLNGSGEGPKHAGQNCPTVKHTAMQAAAAGGMAIAVAMSCAC